MSAATRVEVAPTTASDLRALRDDGPLARALGRVGARVPLGPALLGLAAAAPLAVLVAAQGGRASDAGAALAVGWLVVVAGLAAGRPHTGRLDWTVPPVLRAAEYAGLLWLGALAGDGVPGAVAVLAVLWFHHYDLVYRPQALGRRPPRWLGDLAGGWDGRLVLALTGLVTGALPAGFFLYAALLAVVSVAEAIGAWTDPDRAQPTATYEHMEDEGQ